MGFGKSRHYHLCCDEIHQLEKGWTKLLLIEQSPTLWVEDLLVLEEEAKPTGD